MGKELGERQNKITIYANITGELRFSLVMIMKKIDLELYLAFSNG